MYLDGGNMPSPIDSRGQCRFPGEVQVEYVDFVLLYSP